MELVATENNVKVLISAWVLYCFRGYLRRMCRCRKTNDKIRKQGDGLGQVANEDGDEDMGAEEGADIVNRQQADHHLYFGHDEAPAELEGANTERVTGPPPDYYEDETVL